MNRALAAAAGAPAAWAICVAGGVALSLAAALAPARSAFAVLGLTAAALLVQRLGIRAGLWCLFVATIPLRRPMAVDLAGTTSLHANDVLLLVLAAICAWEQGLRSILRGSAVFRIGLVLAALAIAGLYTATRLSWGVAIALHEAAQVAAFYVAWHWIRDGRLARYTLVAFLAGMIPAVAVGLYQSTLPLRYFQELVGSVPALAWDEAGNPQVRVFSTFEHPLHFSHALSMGAAIAAGLLVRSTAARGFLLVVALAAIVYCNQYTYSIGGLLATTAGILAAIFASRHRWLLLLVPAGMLLFALVAPRAFLVRVENSFTGRNPTTAARIVTYYQTLQVLRDHPLLGVGWGSIRSTLEGDYRVTRDRIVAFTAENYFLERAVATGLVGLAFTVALFALFVRNLRARPGGGDPWPRAALVAGGVAFYVQAQFIPAADPPSRYMLWILFALAERMRAAAAAPEPAAAGGE